MVHPLEAKPLKYSRDIRGTRPCLPVTMQNPMRVLVIGLSSLAGAVGCSGAPIGAGGRDSDAAILRSADDAGSTEQSGLDAGDDALCSNLGNNGSAQFYAIAGQYLTCSSDSDCTRIRVGGAGECADPCGNVLTNEAGASALPAAATMVCQAFVAHGCVVPSLGCLASTVLAICMSGTCEGWNASLSTTATSVVHGVCAPFEIQFITDESLTALAPHDIAFAMTTTNATLYSDSACTIPLTDGTVTLPAGANSVAFGFEPLDAGQSSFEGTGAGATIGMGFLAQ
jgi:hypothetical protein